VGVSIRVTNGVSVGGTPVIVAVGGSDVNVEVIVGAIVSVMVGTFVNVCVIVRVGVIKGVRVLVGVKVSVGVNVLVGV